MYEKSINWNDFKKRFSTVIDTNQFITILARKSWQ